MIATRRFLWAMLAGGVLAFTALGFAGHADASPGQCINTPWGGFCDGLPDRDGVFQHCEGALGFSRCFLVRVVPVEVDPRGWVQL